MRDATKEEQDLFEQMWDNKIQMENDKFPKSIRDEDLAKLLENAAFESVYDGLQELFKKAGVAWNDTRGMNLLKKKEKENEISKS